MSRTSLWVIALCFSTIVFDGYDLIVYGAVVPTMLEYEPWDLTPQMAGAIGSYALIGMLVGTLIVGVLTDIVGRRRIMLVCISWFSVAMGLCAVAPNPELFGVFRFLAGLGLGGVVPTTVALTVEFAPPHRRQLANALMYSGYSVGGILAAALAIPLVPASGFRVMFWIGLLPLVTTVPLAYRYLPESLSFLAARGRVDEARGLARRYGVAFEPPASDGGTVSRPGGRLAGLIALFSRTHIVATALFGAACLLMLLLIYGLNTWLPEIMTKAGYPLGSAIAFLLALNFGAIVGAIGSSVLADRAGPKPVVVTGFMIAAASIFVLSMQLPTGALYFFVTLAGAGTIGTAIIVNGYIAAHYPASSRATGLGWALGVGRIGAILGPIFGGLLVASPLGFGWNFYSFALAALLASLVLFFVPRSTAATPEPTTATASAATR